jgi:hypothetical protein
MLTHTAGTRELAAIARRITGESSLTPVICAYEFSEELPEKHNTFVAAHFLRNYRIANSKKRMPEIILLQSWHSDFLEPDADAPLGTLTANSMEHFRLVQMEII